LNVDFIFNSRRTSALRGKRNFTNNFVSY
jgi:hypothetical protein